MHDLSAGTEADTVRKSIERCKENHASSFLELGAILLHVRDGKLYQDFGYPTFGDFVKDHGLSRSWAFTCAAISVRFGNKALGIQPSRLMKMLSVKSDDGTDEELLESARTLTPTASDFTAFRRAG